MKGAWGLTEFPSIVAGPVEEQIAESIVDRMINGACIQLGVEYARCDGKTDC